MGMQKYNLSLDPAKVERLRDISRSAAAREKRDMTWIDVVRYCIDRLLLDEVRAVEVLAAAGKANNGGHR